MNLLKPAMFLSAITAAFVIGMKFGSQGHHLWCSNADCKDCLIEFDRGFEAGSVETTVNWSEWK